MRNREAKTDPLKPSRADHRIIKRILDASYGGKIVHIPEEYDLIATVFGKAGGSWEGVFDGAIDDLGLLKRVIRVAYKTGRITRSPKWT